jgi:hypothetical protein
MSAGIAHNRLIHPFPWAEHRSIAEVIETEELRWDGRLDGPKMRRLNELLAKKLAFNPPEIDRHRGA